MRDMACSRSLRILLSVMLLCASLPAGTFAQPVERGAPPGSSQAPETSPQDSVEVATATAERMLAESRVLTGSGEYDQAIETLRNALAGGPYPTSLHRDLYLQLIKTYVFQGNHLTYEANRRQVARLSYDQASRMIDTCLRIPALRRTRADSASDYSEKMVTLFAEARDRVLGGFRVDSLDPETATVTLDGDTLTLSTDGVRGDDDLIQGDHPVTVSAPGFKSQSYTVTISPKVIVARSYSLTRCRSRRWYVARAAIVIGVVGAGVLIAGNRHGSAAPAEEPLDQPPYPPEWP